MTVDDDVLLAVQERARREKRSVGAVLSDLARQALTSQHQPEQDNAPASLHGFEPFPHRGPAVSSALIDRLREEEDA
ncbi:MAG: hypothetical protein ACLQDY_11165 [Streptosporangiaceae bacterium]